MSYQHKKNSSNPLSVCVAIFIFKVDEHSNIFGTLGFGISRRMKMPVDGRKDLWHIWEGVVTEWTCREWFAVFCAGGFSRGDAPGWTDQVQWSHPVQMFPEDRPREATWETGHTLKAPESIVENRLHQDGYGHCFGVWVPHQWGGEKTKHHSWQHFHVEFSLKI